LAICQGAFRIHVIIIISSHEDRNIDRPELHIYYDWVIDPGKTSAAECVSYRAQTRCVAGRSAMTV
jgi:hypothetical protein